jgi:hypothetical protein
MLSLSKASAKMRVLAEEVSSTLRPLVRSPLPPLRGSRPQRPPYESVR